VEVTFLNPEYLVLLLSIPMLIISHFLSLKYMKGKAIKIANYPAIERITGKKIRSKNITILLLRCITIFFLIFSVAGTTLWYNAKASDSDYVLAIDSSGSMLAEDFFPDRISAAKKAAIDFIENINEEGKKSRIGVVSFAGTSVIMSELNSNMDDVKKSIEKIDILPTQGTDIANAIITSTNILKQSSKSRKIILISDGQSTAGSSYRDGINYATKNMVSIYIIGIGTEDGGKIEGLTTLTKINEEELREIAEKTGGEYSYVSNETGLKEIYSKIANIKMENKPIKLQLPLLLLAIIFIFVEWGLISSRFRILP